MTHLYHTVHLRRARINSSPITARVRRGIDVVQRGDRLKKEESECKEIERKECTRIKKTVKRTKEI